MSDISPAAVKSLRDRPNAPMMACKSALVEAKGDNVTKEGMRYDNDYCLVFRLAHGKIKEIREYCDSLLTEKALGPFPGGQPATA